MTVIEIALLLVIIWLLLAPGGKFSLSFLSRKQKLILDSCGLIDGRILGIARAGFLTQELIVPQFVLNELQLLADGQDAHKRERARYGLDVAHELQEEKLIEVSVEQSNLMSIGMTDDKLIALAKKLHAHLYTTDYNLCKVAEIEGIHTLNVNELAQNLRPISLPGESIIVKIVQQGENPHQGVGYLEDGTMIVIDGAGKLIGRKVRATVIRMHQTVAGKMVFAEMEATPTIQKTKTVISKKTVLPLRQRWRHKVR